MINRSVVNVLILMLVSAHANAVLYKNPVVDVAEGKKLVGAAFVLMSRDITSDFVGGADVEIDQTLITSTLTYGLGNHSAVEFRLGLDDAEAGGGGGSSDGVLYGLMFRKNIQADGNDLKVGAFASFQGSSLSDDDSDTDIFVYEFGAGVSKELEAGVNGYAGAVLSILEGTIYPFIGSAVDIESSDDLGFFVGIEKQLQDNMKIGFEVNIVHQTGFGVYVEVPF